MTEHNPPPEESADSDVVGAERSTTEISDRQERPRVARFDFSYPDHRLQSRLPVLELINERLARSLTASLSHVFHQSLKVRFIGNHFEKHADYAESLPTRVSATAIVLEPLAGKGYLCIAGQLVQVLVDSYFGGKGQVLADSDAEETREFSPTEQRLLARMRDEFGTALHAAWRPVYEVDPAFGSELSRLEIRSPANPAAVIVSHRFEILLASGCGGELHLVTPYTMLEPIRPRLSHQLGTSGVSKSSNHWQSLFMRSVKAADVELEAVVGEVDVSLKQLLALREGDFIPLPQRRTVTFSVEGLPLFEADVGVSNGMAAATFNHWYTP